MNKSIYLGFSACFLVETVVGADVSISSAL